MSFPDGWTVPPQGKYREDNLDSLRYHALGNAVTPPVAQWIAERIRAYLAERIGERHVEAALREAGSLVGIGRWRPEKLEWKQG